MKAKAPKVIRIGWKGIWNEAYKLLDKADLGWYEGVHKVFQQAAANKGYLVVGNWDLIEHEFLQWSEEEVPLSYEQQRWIEDRLKGKLISVKKNEWEGELELL